MKKILAISCLLSSFLVGRTQTQLTDTSKVEQYCEVICIVKAFSNKVNVEIDFGEFQSNLIGQSVKDIEANVKKFNRVTDALNYIGSQGWTLQNAYATNVDKVAYHFFFKKTFLKSDIVTKPTE